jgi:hypothetical protein
MGRGRSPLLRVSRDAGIRPPPTFLMKNQEEGPRPGSLRRDGSPVSPPLRLIRLPTLTVQTRTRRERDWTPSIIHDRDLRLPPPRLLREQSDGRAALSSALCRPRSVANSGPPGHSGPPIPAYEDVGIPPAARRSDLPATCRCWTLLRFPRFGFLDGSSSGHDCTPRQSMQSICYGRRIRISGGYPCHDPPSRP